ncbi:MAG: DUF362 domain-containing protein [Actinobacteria bacterium]|nr:DUF362 domain-containing protein [Actinomycetota bacterium]
MSPGKPDVALVRCDSYDRGLVEESVGRTFELLGGVGAVVGEGESVFVKVNALLPVGPERAATTHPEVVRAVIRQIQTVTGDITIGDSPGGPFNRAFLKRVYEKAGFADVAAETGASLGFDTSVVEVALPGGAARKSIALCRAMVDADRLISVSKFKTHVFMRLTGAIKNVFGVVPGMTKFTYHSTFHADTDFADLLVDVLLAVSPDLHLVDAVWGMGGDGAVWGDPRKIGVVAAGRDAFALDTLLADLVDLDPRVNLPLDAAVRRGLCSGDPGGINVTGDDPGALKVYGFRLPTKKSAIVLLPAFFMRRYSTLMSLRPYPVRGRCTACGKCAEICPGGAIRMKEGIAVVDHRHCINCFCCHELCEHDGIELKLPPLARLLTR